jgi:hypothetical protein
MDVWRRVGSGERGAGSGGSSVPSMTSEPAVGGAGPTDFHPAQTPSLSVLLPAVPLGDIRAGSPLSHRRRQGRRSFWRLRNPLAGCEGRIGEQDGRTKAGWSDSLLEGLDGNARMTMIFVGCYDSGKRAMASLTSSPLSVLQYIQGRAPSSGSPAPSSRPSHQLLHLTCPASPKCSPREEDIWVFVASS